MSKTAKKYSIRQVPLGLAAASNGERILVNAVKKNGGIQARYVYPCESLGSDRQIVFSNFEAASEAADILNTFDNHHYVTVASATNLMPSRRAPKLLAA